MIEVPTAAELRQRSGRKWRRYPPDVLPAWIADMDLAPAPGITATLAEALLRGDFGYGPAAADSGVPQAFAAWAARRWKWRLDPADVMLMPDVVGGIANCIEALTEPGDAVLVQVPAYPPLLSSVRVAGRRLIEHRLDPGPIDFDALVAALRAERVRMILLCHPHNPSGRVFVRAELEALAAIAEAHGCIVVSDEVHADLTLDRRRHLPFASFAPDRTVTLNSPSKAFNVAGLRLAVCAAPPALRQRLAALPPTRWSAFSTLGVRAALAAWSEGGEAWLTACVRHLESMRDRIGIRLPALGLHWHRPQAGYLAWLDFSEAIPGEDPAAFLLREARVALSPGPDFGAPGQGYARLNFATSHEILTAILDRIEAALDR